MKSFRRPGAGSPNAFSARAPSRTEAAQAAQLRTAVLEVQNFCERTRSRYGSLVGTTLSLTIVVPL